MSNEKAKFTDVNKLGEFGLIQHLTQNFPLKHKSTIKGIGDDAAVLDYNQKVVVSTDLLVEGIHFDITYTPLKHLGYKSIMVNLSDIYAMNATPKHITVSFAISSKYSVEALDEIYAGIKLACDRYNVDLIGGDTTSSPKGLVLSITAIGEAKEEDIVYRNTAKKGDIICVTGNLGAAYLGLQLLEREKQVFMENPQMQPEFDQKDYLIERLLKPEARKDSIEDLAKAQILPTSMIDISDGLASEVFHICKQSKVGAFIEEANVPIHPSAEEQAINFGLDPITCALNGGEDYELLFTIDPKDLEKARYLPDVAMIGEITEESEGIKLHTSGGNIHDIQAQGWVHF